MYYIYFFQFFHSLTLEVKGGRGVGTQFITLEVSPAQTIKFRKKIRHFNIIFEDPEKKTSLEFQLCT